MTTTTHPKLSIILALRDKANATDFPAEAESYMAKARAMCEKFGIDASILDKKAETKSVRDTVINGQAQNTRKYPCRFGCGTWMMHSIDELNACAEKARNANNGNAYGAKRDPFEDLFGGFRNWDSGNAGGHHSYDAPKARAHGSHANCSHEATKSARARCRKNRGF